MTGQPTVRDRFEPLLAALAEATAWHYGARLVSLAVFGSVGRGTPRPDSDIDLLLVADDLPTGRVKRVAEFAAVEASLGPALREASAAGLTPEISPIIKSREEAAAGSMVMLDMIEDARVLRDRDAFLRSALDGLRSRLTRLGARRVWRGDAWYWDLKPDFKPGEVFDL